MEPGIPEEARRRLQGRLTEWCLPEQVVEELTSHYTAVAYPKGFIIFLQGSPADVMFWILSGTVKVYCPLDDGSRILAAMKGPGELLGYADFVDTKGRRSQVFEAHAVTKCSLALFTREHVLSVLQRLDSGTLLRLLEGLNSVWSAKTQRWAAFLGLSFRRRLELTLRDLGSRFGASEARGVLVMPELSHGDLAEMIGSSRPMVSRLIAEMSEQGMLLRSGKRYILANGSGLDVSNQSMLGLDGRIGRQTRARSSLESNRTPHRSAA